MLGHRGLAAKGLTGGCVWGSDGSPLATVLSVPSVNDALEGFQIGGNYRRVV